MNTRLFSFYLLLLLAVPAFAADFASIRPDAERLFEEKSYSRALEAYKKVNLEALGEVERRWVQFRLLDCEWRSLSSTRQPNNARLNDLVELLNREIRDLRGEDQDRVWTEVQESLGDFHWYQRHRRNWYQAWSHYQQALDWWAGSPDLDLARERYIDMVRKVANPLEPGRYYHYGYLGNYLPIEVIKNFQEIAQADEDRALGHFMAGTTLMRSGGGWREMKRVPEEFEKALALGKGTDWYDNALYSLAQWMERSGRVEVDEKRGTWSWKPDYVKALALYRRLTSEFKEGESRHVRQAENQIRNITRRQLNLGVESYFLPGSAVRFSLHWRNVREADFVLYKVDLSKDASLPANGDKAPSWLESVDLGSSSVVHRWDMELEGADLHEPGHKALPIDKTLEKGAYVLEVTGGGEKDRELILISDLVVVTKSVNKDLLVWVTELSSGVPVEGASVSIWERHRGNNRRYFSRQHQGVSDKDGLLKVRLAENKERVDLFVAASKDERQSFATSRSYLYRDTDREQWQIYAVTDRPAYRPGEKVLWKFSARIYDGETYETPASRKVH